MTSPSILSIPEGFCQCGCGQKTTIAAKTSVAHGRIKGEPNRYVTGHARTLPRPDLSGAAPFKIDGVYCRLIVLTQGYYAIVDAADYEWLSSYIWSAVRGGQKDSSHYAVRRETISPKKRITVSMHRQILGLGPGDPEEGDHANGIPLDCRRKNLRPSADEQNHRNVRRHRDNKSGYKGVSYRPDMKTYSVEIMVDGRKIHLGYDDDPAKAHELYKAAAMHVHGEFARTA